MSIHNNEVTLMELDELVDKVHLGEPCCRFFFFFLIYYILFILVRPWITPVFMAVPAEKTVQCSVRLDNSGCKELVSTRSSVE